MAEYTIQEISKDLGYNSVQAELTYFKTKCEKYEKDNDVWKEMYRDKDKQFLELTISKKQENALTIRKKSFWDFIRK